MSVMGGERSLASGQKAIRSVGAFLAGRIQASVCRQKSSISMPSSDLDVNSIVKLWASSANNDVPLSPLSDEVRSGLGAAHHSDITRKVSG